MPRKGRTRRGRQEDRAFGSDAREENKPDGLRRREDSSTSPSSSSEHGSTVASITTSHTTVYSILDPHQLEKSQSPFRGLIYLLWLSMIGGLLSTFGRNYRKHGFLLGTKLYHLAKFDIAMYFAAEMTLMSCVFFAFAVQKAFVKGVLPISLSVYIRHVFQAFLILAASSFAYYREWPFIQTSVLVLHTIAMYMKIHSYFATNEALHRIWKMQDPEKKRAAEAAMSLDRCIYFDGPLRYPETVNIYNFVYYLLVPSLIYQVNPPRASHIRWGVVIEKTFSAVIGLLLMYVIFEHWILPVLFDLETMSLIDAILELLFPFTLSYILLFYFVFEVLCTWCSEVTRYGVRTFYEDWWNSTTFDQFARKWNKPVHQFLYHHIYEESVHSFGFKKSYASIFTFFLFLLSARICTDGHLQEGEALFLFPSNASSATYLPGEAELCQKPPSFLKYVFLVKLDGWAASSLLALL